MRRSIFKPCIDLHNGQVKQIVGGTLSDAAPESLKTNFVARLVTSPLNFAQYVITQISQKSSQLPAYYARLYKDNGLLGGHLIKLGPGNDAAAKEALLVWPGGLQVGGGINDQNAMEWLNAGASKVIVTSYLFPDAKFSLSRLKKLSATVGKDRLVVDVSCRRRNDKWFVAMNKWQDITDMEVTKESLSLLSAFCSEFLIHAADVEGLCRGIDEALVTKLGEWVDLPTTYAGGAKDISDLELVDRLSGGRVDLTYGSSLDIFGGTMVNFTELVDKSK